MKISKINLVNFRNYSKLSLNLGNGKNIFVGDNAQGKTNILEAITVLALTKSHRVGVNPNLIMFDRNSCKISGTIRNNKILSKMEIEINGDIKRFWINKTEIRKVANYVSHLNIIMFTPDDLEIVKGSPNVRRNLLNIQLSQISQIYLKTYNEYNKLLKTRNEYLKILFNNSIADKNYLDIITDKLIEKAIIIYQKRKEYIDLVNLSIDKIFYNISSNRGISIEYVPNIDFDNYDNESLRKKLKHTYKKNYLKELNYGMTIYGPHRDDFLFNFNDHDLKLYGSQGQQKLAILSFKLAEIDIFKDICGSSPVLLLDDIFSEFDIKKRNKLLKMISEKDIQSILTTTDLKNISKKYIENAIIFKVFNGNVERK
ncbi:MAG: DNA replication/repair protein RecF [Bacilli bacterium]|nr:DNA replication/repair protein RecF [Bacilli bacterium]